MSMLGCPRRTDSALDRGIFAAYQGSTFDGWLDPTTQVTQFSKVGRWHCLR